MIEQQGVRKQQVNGLTETGKGEGGQQGLKMQMSLEPLICFFFHVYIYTLLKTFYRQTTI